MVCSLHAASQVGDVGCAKAVSSLDGRCFRQTDFKVGLDAARFLRLGHRDHEAEMVALKFSFAACAAGNLLRDCIAAARTASFQVQLVLPFSVPVMWTVPKQLSTSSLLRPSGMLAVWTTLVAAFKSASDQPPEELKM